MSNPPFPPAPSSSPPPTRLILDPALRQRFADKARSSIVTMEHDRVMDMMVNNYDNVIKDHARVQNNSVIFLSAANLALDEFFDIIDNKTNRRIFQTGGIAVRRRRVDGKLRSVNVANCRASLCASKRRSAGVAEQIQNGNRLSGRNV